MGQKKKEDTVYLFCAVTLIVVFGSLFGAYCSEASISSDWAQQKAGWRACVAFLGLVLSAVMAAAGLKKVFPKLVR